MKYSASLFLLPGRLVQVWMLTLRCITHRSLHWSSILLLDCAHSFLGATRCRFSPLHVGSLALEQLHALAIR